ncbi:MAG: hydrogenase maturation protease [Leptolyngbya sp. SIO1E4]|nr:hydrogenase maturation protease [Leptolyngbya sp. SIO1E4]
MAEVVNSSFSEAKPTIVVIGYGNPQRGDDAIGQTVISRLKTLKIPAVEAFLVTQLTPELADKLTAADFAIFVDACKLKDVGAVKIKSLDACGSETAGSAVPAFGHSCDPCSLLALAASAYGHCPKAWWVEVPASDFTAGQPLSGLAERGVEQALDAIVELIDSVAQTVPNGYSPTGETRRHSVNSPHQ